MESSLGASLVIVLIYSVIAMESALFLKSPYNKKLSHEFFVKFRLLFESQPLDEALSDLSPSGLNPTIRIRIDHKPFSIQSLKAQMFFLSLIEHTLRLPPHLLSLPLDEAIKGEIETLFLDKVIANLGLCISVYDISSIDGGFIFAGDGASTYTVKFRLIMFRPFVGEIITAKLKESDTNGLRLSLGFFDDIYIPTHLMPNTSQFEPDPENKNRVRWIWEFQGEKYPIDGMDEIRFRVHSVNYPSIPVERPKESKPFAPMVVTGSLDYDGLGPISWWV